MSETPEYTLAPRSTERCCDFIELIEDIRLSAPPSTEAAGPAAAAGQAVSAEQQAGVAEGEARTLSGADLFRAFVNERRLYEMNQVVVVRADGSPVTAEDAPLVPFELSVQCYLSFLAASATISITLMGTPRTTASMSAAEAGVPTTPATPPS